MCFYDYARSRVMNSIFDAHDDFIRAVSHFQGNQSTIVTGSLDKTCKLFDIRANAKKEQALFTHGEPISCVRVFGDDLKMTTVGGRDVKKYLIFRCSPGT